MNPKNSSIVKSIPMAKAYFLSHQLSVDTDGPDNNPENESGHFDGQDTTTYAWQRTQAGVFVQAIYDGGVMFSFFV